MGKSYFAIIQTQVFRISSITARMITSAIYSIAWSHEYCKAFPTTYDVFDFKKYILSCLTMLYNLYYALHLSLTNCTKQINVFLK